MVFRRDGQYGVEPRHRLMHLTIHLQDSGTARMQVTSFPYHDHLQGTPPGLHSRDSLVLMAFSLPPFSASQGSVRVLMTGAIAVTTTSQRGSAFRNKNSTFIHDCSNRLKISARNALTSLPKTISGGAVESTHFTLIQITIRESTCESGSPSRGSKSPGRGGTKGGSKVITEPHKHEGIHRQGQRVDARN